MEINGSTDFLYCSYKCTCMRHVESLIVNYYKYKYMAIVNVQQWQISCKHCNLLTIETQMHVTRQTTVDISSSHIFGISSAYPSAYFKFADTNYCSANLKYAEG